MDAELRTLIDHSKFHKGAVREVAKLLPESDDSLNALIAETIAIGDQLGFVMITTAALDAGRRVDAQHLERGTSLCGDQHRLGGFAWKMDGDVPGALMAAVKRGGIARELQAGALFIVASWCLERRAGELPPEFAAESRNLARAKGLNNSILVYLAGIALRVKDEGFAAVLSQNYPDLLLPHLLKPTEDVIDAAIEVFRQPAIDYVPDTAEVLAAGRPMQRAVEKLGRNDLCHCGSGKKYKRCCFEKDKERLHFSTEVAGHTSAELRAQPEAGLTESRINAMPPFELARIDPRKVPENLLRCYIMRVTGCQILDRAVEVFEVVEWNEESIDAWNFVLFFVMKEQRKELAERMLAAKALRAREGAVEERAGVRLLIARDDPAAELRVLTETAMEIFRETDSDKLVGLGYGVLCSRHAALGILICRSLFPLVRPKEASFLLEQILSARDRLNLPPDDPYGDVLEKRLAEETNDEGADAAALREARKKLDAKAAEVRQLHDEIERKRRALERREKKPDAASKPAAQTAADEAERRDLRQKLAELKGTLHERSAERTSLRHELEKAREDLDALRQDQSPAAPTNHTETDDEAAHYLPEQPTGNQPIRLIEFPHKFRETLEDLPRQAARSALAMIGRLAGGEPAAFAGVVQLRACHGILRQRIGSEHRLLFRLHPDRVQVVDLINRRDLDRRIKSLRAS